MNHTCTEIEPLIDLGAAGWLSAAETQTLHGSPGKTVRPAVLRLALAQGIGRGNSAAACDSRTDMENTTPT